MADIQQTLYESFSLSTSYGTNVPIVAAFPPADITPTAQLQPADKPLVADRIVAASKHLLFFGVKILQELPVYCLPEACIRSEIEVRRVLIVRSSSTPVQ
ncbi:MAG: hypothetical protein NTZ78_02700 [Candidatus Aureabacteria bacterium]|nr:hypothetical protein [Candidatus Auribacterota bacterium]